MSYTIINADGTTLATLAPGTSDSATTSLTLVGKNFPGYGQFLNENFVLLLENFASASAPVNPQEGQLWWNKADGTNATKNLQVYLGDSQWKRISGATSGTTQPNSAYTAIGDFWWDSANAQLKVFNGDGWTVIGPAFTASTGQSGALADTLSDGSSTHVVIKYLINNKLAAIMSTDAAFTPVPSLITSGFSTIKPGINLADDGIGGSLVGLRYWGNANNALNLGGSSAAVFARLDGTSPFTAAQTISNSNGLTIGAANEFNVSTVTGAVQVISTVTSNNMDFYANVSGVKTKLLTLGGDGTVKILANTALGSTTSVATKKYVDDSIVSLGLGGSGGYTTFSANVQPSANVSYDLGSTTNWWNNIYGTAIHARYADVAERFEIDNPQPPGTVVEIGGEKEITAVGQELSENILGVISTRAAYLMNSGAGTDITHPPIAVSGRVPVRVIGKVKKGDRLVSAGNGLARSGARTEISPWNVIGRALDSKTTSGEGIIEATVKLNS